MAFQFYKKVGNIIGQANVGYCYYLGIGTKKDFKRAAFWYENAVNNGNLTAMCNLGILYKNGEGVGKDHTKAIRLFKQSARGNYSGGFLMLVYCFECGIETNIDLQKAAELYYN